MAEVYGVAYNETSASEATDAAMRRRPQKKQSRRLSKPRTNSSSANTAKPHISLGDLNALTKSAATSVADLLSPGLDKFGARHANESAVLDDSKQIQDEKDLRNGSVDSSANEVAPKNGRIQRTGTKLKNRLSVHKSHPFKTPSMPLMDQSGDSDDYEWLKEKAEKDFQAMRNHRVSRTKETEQEVLAPYRRKSLLMPGLATRGNDILRKPGSVSDKRLKANLDVQSRYYDQNLSPVSPLTRIASLDVPGRHAGIMHEHSRAMTPSDGDYGRIGGFLRIANGGAASPSLSLATQNDKALTSPDGYLQDESDQFYDAQDHIAADIAEDNYAVQVVDPDIYDPYAEDAGNPWAEDQEVVHEINEAFQRAGQSTDKPLPESPLSPDNALFTTTLNEPDQPIADNLSYTTEDELYDIEKPARGRTGNSHETMSFEDEPPIINPTISGAPAHQHRPDTGEAGLRNSRLEMARVLENMMAASRYTPVQTPQDEWSFGPSSASSEIPSLSWGRSDSSSDTSLSSASREAAEMTFPPQGKVSSQRSRARPGAEAEDVIPQPLSTPVRHSLQSRPGQTPKSNLLKELPPNPSLGDDADRTSSPIVFVTNTGVEAPEFTHRSDSPTKMTKSAPKKLQKRAPRPMSMPPTPVEHIVVTGHRGNDQGSPIPEIPEDMRMQLAERWNSRPIEDREPTIPNVVGDQSAGYFSQPQITKNQSTPQFSPDAPPIPQKSMRRQSRPASYHPSRNQSVPPMMSVCGPEELVAQEAALYMEKQSSLNSPGSMHGNHSNLQSPYHSPQVNSGYQTGTDDEDVPIDWAQVRLAWAARRRDAGEGLRTQIDRAREDIEATGSVFRTERASWAQGSQPYNHRQDRYDRRGHGQQSKGASNRQSLQINLPMHHSPMSQPSAAPSPLKQATSVSDFSEYSASNYSSYSRPRSQLQSNRHMRNSRSDPHGSYFPPVEGMGNSGRRPTRNGHEVKDEQRPAGAGRYDNGFAFGFERGKGVGGSAGTRSAGGQTASRKGGAGNLAEGFGVDLSDVPIFVAKAGE